MESQSPKPEYDGECAFALSLGRQADGKESQQITEGDRVYYFANPVAKLIWKVMPNRAAKADENWASRGAS